MSDLPEREQPIDPPEGQEVSGTITITYGFEQESFPAEWDIDEIIRWIKANPSDYTNDIEDIEVELD